MEGQYIENDDHHEAIMQRILALFNCKKRSEEEKELEELVAMVEEYEKRRFPFGIEFYENEFFDKPIRKNRRSNNFYSQYSSGILKLPPR